MYVCVKNLHSNVCVTAEVLLVAYAVSTGASAMRDDGGGVYEWLNAARCDRRATPLFPAAAVAAAPAQTQLSQWTRLQAPTRYDSPPSAPETHPAVGSSDGQL